ncbi:MAG: hypothetical protein IT449_00095 [Phycisphaerales bacterium]|nr:hypothetical protein [Phycisphaerales bacterium]
MNRLVLSSAAAFEIAEAAASYEATRPGLGRTFVRHIDRLFNHIRRYPESAPVIEAGFRRAVVYRFPFCVVYRVQPDAIQVIGVLTTRSDPMRLMERLTAAAGR